MNYSDFTVVMPTLNEEENIATIMGHLLGAYKGIHIIAADGGSTDGTRSLVNRMAKKTGRVRFLPNPYKSKTRNITESIAEGIIASRTKYVISMDADMQHPYLVIAQMAALLSSGNEIVPAVRANSHNWALYRVIISRLLNDLGLLVLILNNKERCSNVTTGFFGIERKLFAKIYAENRKRYVLDGIRVFYDTLKCIDRGKVKIAEVPFIYEGRIKGDSKMGFRQGIKAITSYLT